MNLILWPSVSQNSLIVRFRPAFCTYVHSPFEFSTCSLRAVCDLTWLLNTRPQGYRACWRLGAVYSLIWTENHATCLVLVLGSIWRWVLQVSSSSPLCSLLPGHSEGATSSLVTLSALTVCFTSDPKQWNQRLHPQTMGQKKSSIPQVFCYGDRKLTNTET